jgi:hypothetical protein
MKISQMSGLRLRLGCVLVFMVVATSAAAKESHQQELQELRQLVSTLVGAEPVDQGSGERISVVLLVHDRLAYSKCTWEKFP